MIDPAKFLEDLSGKHARNYTSALTDMLVAMAMGNRAALDDARKKLEEVITETMGTAEVLGATITLRAAAGALLKEEAELFRLVWRGTSEGAPNTLRMPAVRELGDRTLCTLYREQRHLLAFKDTTTQTILPRVTFTEALQDMVDRTPVTIRDAAERTAQRISQLYGEGRVVAFAHSAEQAVTDRVQSLITQAIREGIPEAEAGTLIRMGVDKVREETAAWTEGYARMAFRTNVNTAVTAGRFRQAQDKDIKAVIPAFRYDTVGDSDTRPNHQAGDGLIFLVDNTVWNRFAPPNGWNCRCSLSLVGLPELRRMGRVGANGSIREDRLPAAARPDAGFRHGGRPDLFLVGITT